MKTKEITAMAKTVKTYIEKNHKFPKTIKQNGKTYTYAEYTYYFVEFIKNKGKEVKNKSVKNNHNSTGVSIDEQVTESDYRDQCKRISQFVLQNGVIPNFVTTVASRKKVRPRDYSYAFSRIVAYYDAHNQFPRTCRYNSKVYTAKSTVTNKKYGRSIKTGCDQRGQNTGYNCGPHMAQEIVRNLTGKVIPQSTIASVMGTTTKGTCHDGINTFFSWFNKKYGFNLKVEWKNFSDVGWKGIKKILESENQDCGLHELYRDQYGHYTNYDKVYENSVDVHNSLGSMCTSSCYCGYTENRSKSTAQRYLNGISQKSVIIVTRS